MVETASTENLYRMRKSHRVVVTGAGAVTPIGLDLPATWQSRIAGRSGIQRISTSEWENKEDTAGSEVDIAGLVMGLDVSPLLAVPRDSKRLHRSAQMSLQAGREALVQAGLLHTNYLLIKGEDRKESPLLDLEAERFGMIIGTGIGGGSVIAELEDIIKGIKKDRSLDALAMLLILPERAASVPSMFMDAKAEVSTIGSACATGALAITAATRIIRDGEADVMLAGASEAAVHRIAFRGFNNIHALNNRSNEGPLEASRPFDQEADGFVMGEGAGVLVLESLEHALSRGANILVEVLGYGNTADSHHDTAPNPMGPTRAMRKALAMAELDPSEVDYINAHGTSTPTNDPNEIFVLRGVFGDKLPAISISSDKGAIGHLLGASGAVEAAIVIEAFRHSMVPPNLNLHNPIAGAVGLDLPVTAKRRRVNVVMSNSFGFGGLNTSLIFARYEQNPTERVA